MEVKAVTKIVSWSFYDLAAKFFTLNIVTLHFARWLTLEKNTSDIYYGLTLVLLALNPLGVLRYRIAMILLGLFIIPALYYFIRVPERRG